MRKEKGITLIALVVTIVVLLILAGVSISMLIGENGIITEAKYASFATKVKQYEEIIKVYVIEEMQKNENSSVNITDSEKMKEILGKIEDGDENKYVIQDNELKYNPDTVSEQEEEWLIKLEIEAMGENSPEEPLNKTLKRKWVAKIDGNGEEEFLDVEKTSDGGYIAVGYSTSTNISGLTNKGDADCLIVKYDKDGNEKWKKSVGGSKFDCYSGVIEITNETYIAVGSIYSTDVVDKNGDNIGHGYDWFIDVGVATGNLLASEGIIGKYDSNGNEISLEVTGLATNDFREDGYADFDVGKSVANIKISGIDKVSDGGYIITGSRTVGVPSTFIITEPIDVSQLAIKYNKNGEKIAQLINGKDSYGDPTSSFDGQLKGVVENKEHNYILFGNVNRDMSSDSILITNSNLEIVEIFGRTSKGEKNIILDNQDKFITLEISLRDDTFFRIYKQDGWEKTDVALKSISKSDEESFVGITEDNRFLKYNMEDGSIIEEYDIPTYESIYAIEGEEEFILLGTPTNEEGITIEGASGAVIAKYAIE